MNGLGNARLNRAYDNWECQTDADYYGVGDYPYDEEPQEFDKDFNKIEE